MRRGDLLAYLVGAGVAGTLIIFPYAGNSILSAVHPDFAILRHLPFFVLPVVWGMWNWIYVRLQPRLGIGAWGGILGCILPAGANLILLGAAQWFAGAALLLLFIPPVYYLLWLFVVGPLNDALGVDG